MQKIGLFANTDWYLFNFKLSLAEALRDAGHEVLLISPPGKYGDLLRQRGFDWRAVPMDRQSLNPWREIRVVRHLQRLLARERVDLLHSFTIKCAVYGSLAARLAGVPARVATVAGMGYVFTNEDLKARILRPVVRSLLRLALDGKNSRLILQNPDDADLFRRAQLADPSSFRLIAGSGVNCELFSPRELDVYQRRHPFRVLLPARLLWEKGISEFVDAARLLQSQGRSIEFLLAGDSDPGNPAAVPSERVQSWAHEGTIKWLGHVSDMPALFAAVDAVVLPSYREGLPKGLIEAAACGLPLVTTDVPGCRDVVTNDLNGLLIPAKNAAALAEAIGVLEADPTLCARLGQQARIAALDRFDEKHILAQTMAVYSEFLKESRC